MNPATIQLPDIYRGSSYPAILFNWKDPGGQVFNLNGWIPLCFAKDFNFNAQVINLNLGQTRISLSHALTMNLKLGKQSWDFIWVSGGKVYPPILSGVVEVKEPLSDTTVLRTLVDDTAPDGPVTEP